MQFQDELEAELEELEVADQLVLLSETASAAPFLVPVGLLENLKLQFPKLVSVPFIQPPPLQALNCRPLIFNTTEIAPLSRALEQT